jgi:proteasome accessory factor A
MSSATTRSRPMINTRDEPHAHADLYRRLHVIVGDSSMAEPTALLKVGATDLILRLLEARVAMPPLALAREMQAIRDISHDMSGAATVELADGRSLSAVQIQEQYLDLVRSHVGGIIEPDAMTDRILDLWARGIEAVRTGDSSAVWTELDWAIKLRLIERLRGRTGVPLDDPTVARLDLAYHDVAPGRGLQSSLVAQGLMATIVPEEAIVRAVERPPETTRAKLRGDFVRAGIGAHRDFTADWVRLKIVGDEGRTVLLKDPFRSEDARVDALIASITPLESRVD